MNNLLDKLKEFKDVADDDKQRIYSMSYYRIKKNTNQLYIVTRKNMAMELTYRFVRRYEEQLTQ